jgi:hypothetical protein
MSNKDKGGWFKTIANAATSAVKAVGMAFRKVAKFFAKVITGSVHYPALAIEYAVRMTIKAIKIVLFVIAAIVVAIVLAAVFVVVVVLMTAYKIVNGVGLLIRAPFDLTRPNGKNGVKTNFALYAKSWHYKYFQSMTPGDVVRREMTLNKQAEYATAWRLINEANEEIKKNVEERAQHVMSEKSRPASSKKGRQQPSRGSYAPKFA